MQQGQQQVFIREHDGSLLPQRPLFGSQFPQDRSHVLALHGVRYRGNRFDSLRRPEMIVRKFAPGGKQDPVLAQEHTGLLVGIVRIISIVIPVEIGFGSRGEKLEKPFLALRERVEARHDEPPGLRECETAGLDPLGGRPVYHPRIGHPQRPEPLAESPIYRAQRLPNGQEAAFLLGKGGFVREIGPESDDFQLDGAQIRYVGLQLLDVGQVAEKHIGVDQVLVDRIEIREEHLPPEIELVEGFGMKFRIDFIQFGHQTHPVADAETRNLAHQLVDSRPAGLPQRTFGDAGQGVDKEKPRTSGREQNRKGRNIVPVSVV